MQERCRALPLSLPRPQSCSPQSLRVFPVPAPAPVPAHLGHELHDVERQLVGACVRLHDGGEERLGVEHARQPHAVGQHHLARGPRRELLVALDDVGVPRRQHRVGGDALGERLHLVGHVERTVQTERQLLHGPLHLHQQRVHAHRLLQRDHHIRRLVLDAQLHLDHVERLGQLVQEGLQARPQRRLAPAAAAAAPAAASRHVNDRLEQSLALRRQQRQLRVGVHAVHHRRLRGQRVLNVLLERLVARRQRRLEARRQLKRRLRPRRLVVQRACRKDLRSDEHVEVGGAAAAVHAVGDVAAVEDLAKHVPQVRPRHKLVCLEVVVQHVAARRQVAHVERVAAAESEPRARAGADADAKLFAAEQQRVVEAETEEDGAEHGALDLGRRPLALLLREGGKRAPHVGLHVGRRLVGDLDARLQDGLGHDLGKRRAVDGLSREEAAEVGVRRLGRDLQLALQPRHPALHEVHIVEEHPAALLGVTVEHGLGGALLALAHGNERELAVLDAVADLVGVRLDLFGRRVAGEQDEEDGRGAGRLVHHRGGAEGLLVDVVAAHDLLAVVGQRVGDAVGAQRAHDEQLLELGQLGPVAGHRRALGRLEPAPARPVLRALLHVLGQVDKRRQRRKHVERRPLRLIEPARQVVGDWRRVGVLEALAHGLVLGRVDSLGAQQDRERQER
eukprot:187204-Chlamydomonas_euryale.AAC.1